jgi:hypothetical protein
MLKELLASEQGCEAMFRPASTDFAKIYDASYL